MFCSIHQLGSWYRSLDNKQNDADVEDTSGSEVEYEKGGEKIVALSVKDIISL